MPTEAFQSPIALDPGQADPTATVDRTFPVGEHCRLSVDNPRGKILVTTWDRPEIHLRATKLAGGSSLPRYNATHVEVSHDGSTVAARTVLDVSAPFRDPGLWNDLLADAVHSFADLLRNTAMSAEVIYEIQVPRHADLELRGVTNQISVTGVRGAVRAHSVSGPVTLEQIQGDLVVTTVSGRVEANEIAGYLDARSVSASIRAYGRLDVVKANTVSGSMAFASPLSTSGTYDFYSVSGSVTLRLPEDSSASISARGVSLVVTSDLPCQVLADSRGPGSREWRGRLNDGAANVQFRTVSGQLYLAKPPDAEASADSAAQHEPPPESEPAKQPDASPGGQLEILRALERGDLAVEEALRRLAEQRG